MPRPHAGTRTRGVINHRVKRFFQSAVSEQLIPPAVYEGLRTVSGLEKGRTTARETDLVSAVDNAQIDRGYLRSPHRSQR